MATQEALLDGGYYAIKGFTFQFDKSLIETLSNPESDVLIEQIQDVGREDYYIQVKHKETQTYSPSKIRKPIKQLIDNHLQNPGHKFELYCFFDNESPRTTGLTLAELDKILGPDSKTYTVKVKRSFLKLFSLTFSENFDTQFNQLIELILDKFELQDKEQAIMYHASFRAELMDIAIKKIKSSRVINYQLLQELATRHEKVIFQFAYKKYLTNDRYLKYIKNNFFTFKKPNVAPNERLFIITYDGDADMGELASIVRNISNRYCIKDSSPAPYILFSAMDLKQDVELRRDLWSKRLFFSDGTNFDGDRFRLSSIIQPFHRQSQSPITYRLIREDNLTEILQSVTFDEVYEFFCGTNRTALPELLKSRKFFVEKISDVLKVIT